jgi:hypothetical protein
MCWQIRQSAAPRDYPLLQQNRWRTAMSKQVYHDLLGGAVRTKVRPRGFVPWSPQAATLQLLDQVRAVLDEYEDYLPLTLRQIFYRLVGAHAYDKTEQAYECLCEHLARARRARMIPMGVIRDDGGTIIAPSKWDSTEQFWRVVRRTAENFTLDRSTGQKTRLVVMSEAAGMAPQLSRTANPLGVTVLSGGGFDSLTDKHKFAAELASHDRPTEVLHIGDHDASGVSMFLAFLEDVEAFARDLGGDCTFTRLAVTPAQIRQHRLPTAPPKKTDNRAFTGQTCQAEALAPDVLANILRSAIEERIDRNVFDRVIERETKIRRQLLKRVDSI